MDIMSKVIWCDKDQFLNMGYKYMKDVDSLLDIGTGIVPHDYISAKIYICSEPYAEYLNVLKKKVQSGSLGMNSIFVLQEYDWQTVIKKFKYSSVDTVFLIDVVEHLEKEIGKDLLKETEKIAQKQIVIFTPLDYIEQKTINNKDAWGLSGVEQQVHKSVWKPTDFDDSWTCICCADYHTTNNIGEVLKKPVGAFWAIKDYDGCKDAQFLYPDKENLFLSIGNYIDAYKKSIDSREKLKNDYDSLILQYHDLMIDYNTLNEKYDEIDRCKIDLEKKINTIENSHAWSIIKKYYRLRDCVLRKK